MNLLSINVWLDIVFPLVWKATGLFLAFHFLMAIITGRARKSFIEGKWPEHDSVPPPLPKFLHAQHMFMMIVLAITGMYIRYPWFAEGRSFMRGLHYFAMIVVTVNLVWRIWYAFFSKNRDWQEFAIRKKDAVTLGGVLKYYGYMSNSKPHVAKYNVAQKGSYIFFLVLMIAQAFTGFALLPQPILFGVSLRNLLIGWWLGPLAGSEATAAWIMRTVHFTINWLFIIMTTVHVYLSATIDVPCTLDFFGLKKMKINPNAHHDDVPATPREPVVVPATSSDL